MPRYFHSAVAAGGIALLAACTSPPPAPVTPTSLLEQAGFVRKNANTPERLAAMRMLPPHHFVLQNSNGSVKYLYADPLECGCIYVGGQRAYNDYQRIMAARVRAEQIRAIVSTANLPIGAGLNTSGR